MTDGASSGGLILLCGLPASGKTTVAEILAERIQGTLVLSSDRIRGKRKSGRKSKVWDHMAEMARLGLQEGRTVMIDATNYTGAHRQRFTSIADDLSRPWLIVYLTAEMETLLRRNAGREESIPRGAIHHLARLFEAPEGEDVIELDSEADTPAGLAEAVLDRYFRQEPKGWGGR